MMNKNIALLLAVILFFARPIMAEPGIKSVLSVFQHNSDAGGNTLLLQDTVSIVEGLTASGFFLNFSIDLNLNKVDSLRTSFDIHLVTLGPNAATRSHETTTLAGWIVSRSCNQQGFNVTGNILTIGINNYVTANMKVVTSDS